MDNNQLAEILIERLMQHFQVNTISKLATYIDVSQPSISAWKKNGYVNAIKKKCRELGIYQDIFGDTQVNDFRNSSFDGNTTGVICGNQANINHDSNDSKNCDDLTKELVKKLCTLYKDDQMKLQTKLFELISDANSTS